MPRPAVPSVPAQRDLLPAAADLRLGLVLLPRPRMLAAGSLRGPESFFPWDVQFGRRLGKDARRGAGAIGPGSGVVVTEPGLRRAG